MSNTKSLPDDEGKHENEFVLGRGKLFFAGRYLGNTSKVTLITDPISGLRSCHIECQDISDENVKLWAASFNKQDQYGPLLFEANNPLGRNRNWMVEKTHMVAARWGMKDDDYMALCFNAQLISDLVMLQVGNFSALKDI